jgi:hypothetical protein
MQATHAHGSKLHAQFLETLLPLMLLPHTNRQRRIIFEIIKDLWSALLLDQILTTTKSLKHHLQTSHHQMYQIRLSPPAVISGNGDLSSTRPVPTTQFTSYVKRLVLFIGRWPEYKTVPKSETWQTRVSTMTVRTRHFLCSCCLFSKCSSTKIVFFIFSIEKRLLLLFRYLKGLGRPRRSLDGA